MVLGICSPPGPLSGHWLMYMICKNNWKGTEKRLGKYHIDYKITQDIQFRSVQLSFARK